MTAEDDSRIQKIAQDIASASGITIQKALEIITHVQYRINIAHQAHTFQCRPITIWPETLKRMTK